ncbi:MAG TPA: serine/threonine-protein kinase [Bacteroidales bacterium]|nr:serine/threonine-protein kinase [Balneolales bacterium]HYX05371.1 serine/threonine-protein kinase [Bacteroidales bacterium]
MKALDEITSKCSDVQALAKGGQKSVLSAIHPQHGKVVIKFGEYRSINSIERIKREVELLKELNSMYYPKHFEFIIDDDNREFLIIEECIDGKELSESTSAFTEVTAILSLIQDLVKGLNIIWAKNVIHRDIKPANILIKSDGLPVIIDLGIARFLDKASLTHSIAARGPATPIYAAPEQLRNRKPMIGVRTDFFLLGILALELYHGFHPFDPQKVGNHANIVDNILNGIYLPPNSSNNTFNDFIEGVLKVQPYQRFRLPQELADHLGIKLIL